MKIKCNGMFQYDMEYHQDQSALIIPKAAERALVFGESIEEFITSHTDKYDFMLRTKIPRNSQLVLNWSEYDNARIPLNRITRYFISKTGGSLVKISPPTGKLGTWKRARNVKEDYYRRCLLERVEGELDIEGTPHDPRIHTKNKSVHIIREMNIDNGWKVISCNDIKCFDWSYLNYEYYIKKTYELIDPIL